MNARVLVVLAGCAALFVLTVMLWVAAPTIRMGAELAALEVGANPQEVPRPMSPAFVLSNLATGHLIVYTILVVGVGVTMIAGALKGKISPVFAWVFLAVIVALDTLVILTIHVAQPRF